MPDADIYRAEFLRCQICGHDNPGAHKFCGACGAVLPQSQLRSIEGPTRIESISEAQAEESRRDSDSGLRSAESQPATAYDDISMFRSFREAEHGGDDEFESSLFRPFRVYVGVALAVVLIAIAYVAVRHGQFGTRTRSEAPPPAATTEAPEKPATPSSAPSPAPSTTPASPSADAHPNVPPTVPEVPAKRAAPDDRTRAERTSAKTSRGRSARGAASAEKTATRPSAPTSVDNGAEELATARRYLGAGGQPRDANEAAKWLWKSIAKHNAAATVLLADLYLKGDGVSKNCDQARVLLDTAARKGEPGAGERIRNLPAFGCQ